MDSMEDAMPTITISNETHEQLKKLGVYGDTLDSIILRTITHYTATHPPRRRRAKAPVTKEAPETQS